MWVYTEIATLSELAILLALHLMTIRRRRKRETTPTAGVHAAERWDRFVLRDLAACAAVIVARSAFHPIERRLKREPLGREAC